MFEMTPEMKLFFDRLLDVKKRMNDFRKKCDDPEFIAISDELNDIIKKEG